MSTTSTADTSQTPKTTHGSRYPTTIIGIYGVSGCGKSYLSDQLKAKLDDKIFTFYEGSKELAELVPGGLEEFKKMQKATQDVFRAGTIEAIRNECAKSLKIGVITGHYMFWDRLSGTSTKTAMTSADKNIYTHILYLKTDAETIVKQVANDSTRLRTHFDAETIRKWQDLEESQLRSTCRENDILFTTIQPDNVREASKWLQDTIDQNECINDDSVNVAVDNMLRDHPMSDVKTMLVLDADHTLAPHDASSLYWQKSGAENPLKAVFKSPLGYSYTAFRQVAWLYEKHVELRSSSYYEDLCEEAASSITIHSEMHDLLQRACADKTVAVIVVTCGIRRVWEKVLEKLGLSDTVPVIGNGLLSNVHVITTKAKGDIVTRLKYHNRKSLVCAIGDSEVDLQMLKNADKAFIVVGPEKDRSKSFDLKLQNAVDNEGLRAHQILLPQEPKPRLDTCKIPTAKLDESFLITLTNPSLIVYDASKKPATKLLASSTRNVDMHGVRLQQAHENAGWYLATEYVSLALGVEAFDIVSVQGIKTQGHRLLDEEKTCIVPLMRGGDPIARGVHKAFPAAMYLHAKIPSDIQPKHIAGKNTIILADWVINTGSSMVEFVRHIRETLSCQCRIVMVAGVVQEDAVGGDGVDGILARELAGMGEMTLVALRISKNKYKGVGGTDTGHRLFNTTHLD